MNKRKILDEFEKKWNMTSDEMLEKTKNQPDYRKKLTVAETVWMVEYGQYRVLMDLLNRG